MRYVMGFISLVIFCIIVVGFVAMFIKPKVDKSHTVIIPKFVLIWSVICTSLFLTPVVFTLFSEKDFTLVIGACYLALACFGATLIIGYFNCRIDFNENDFTYRTFFGVKRTIQYKDLTSYQYKNMKVTLFAGKYAIGVEDVAINNNKFVSLAHRQYQKYHNGAKLPKSEKKDLFNNHVENPAQFIIVFVMLIVLCVGLTILSVVMTMPKKITDFEAKTVNIESYEISEKTLVLYDDFGTIYKVRVYASIMPNASDFIEELKGKPKLDLLVLYKDVADPYYDVSSIIKDDSTQYLSYDEWYKSELKNHRLVLGIFAVIDLFILSFIGGAIYVGRNANKFSDKVLHIFYRPGYIHRDEE